MLNKVVLRLIENIEEILRRTLHNASPGTAEQGGLGGYSPLNKFPTF